MPVKQNVYCTNAEHAVEPLESPVYDFRPTANTSGNIREACEKNGDDMSYFPPTKTIHDAIELDHERQAEADRISAAAPFAANAEHEAEPLESPVYDFRPPPASTSTSASNAAVHDVAPLESPVMFFPPPK
ncbi:hypothetical protein [Alienimonas chondri]|uniref:Uncharacterized protein n=1 Tax=Alienimonas chondri TaxID=2681879 RepID=A0ABX1VH94_9PLAN|nr:hypothetical protein [Alienimonas chondri]NNJ26146.1 hypothetical protein [Alienimonas chondri]